MKYIRMHQVEAVPMTQGDYYKSRGINAHGDYDPGREGYKVTYPDGYVSWCPKAQFEKNAFTDAEEAPFRSIPDPDQLLMLLRIFHDERYSNCSGDEKATRLVHAYYNEYVGRPNGFLTFGQAIEAMKSGKKVARKGWNGKGMYLWLLPATEVKKEWCLDPRLLEAIGDRETLPCLGAIRMFTATKEVLTGWLASQTDMLAEDWLVIE